MAEKKKNQRTSRGSKKENIKAPSSKAAKKETEKSVVSQRAPEEKLIHQILPYVWSLLAVFVGICLFSNPSIEGASGIGILGSAVKNVICGLFAGAAIAVPALLLLAAYFWKTDVKNVNVGYKLIYAFLFLTFLSVLINLISTGDSTNFDVVSLWSEGLLLRGGGVIGGGLGALFIKIFGFTFTVIIAVFMVLTFCMFLFGLTPRTIAESIRKRRARHEEAMKQRQIEKSRLEAKREYMNTVPENPDISSEPQTDGAEAGGTLEAIDVDVIDEAKAAAEAENGGVEAIVEDGVVLETVKPSRTNKKIKAFQKNIGSDAVQIDTSEICLEEIFVNPEKSTPESKNMYSDEVMSADVDLSLTADGAASEEDEALVLQKKRVESDNGLPQNDKPSSMNIYRFPPITLLQKAPPTKNVDISAELETNGQKLVDTLKSFNVRTKIVNISRGPTVTRYELSPDAGTRVRSIANLVDDIALNLATTGVRIEAPIPGKCAVGIEVPNKNVSTVYVRELIENPAFREAPSKLNAALGVDVAGTPVYVDLPKMPHLLIAGATGMGKSVCLNSIIVSILYKAMPTEVKFILIDPKKVELGIYNGIPHLLIPVVTDPKKAAGALHWAVTEMERRFELIEDVGARDIKGYNSITKNDPDREFLPHIVIVIDELADLMMSAPDEVEDSICRLAQKARAAGMCLIIGTQRPSVDVITGLIKANVPSRIAFTVASQVDSRTIIDIQGAEKLIGRGDMLYAPVGYSKPRRVQGAFVSEEEIESITDFLKTNSGEVEYADGVMEIIEKEAQRCGVGKKGRAAIDGESVDEPNADPMLKAAIELAVESGKISTSLIQRRLSLGYGRAAKLIDKMEQMNIVSAPEGQKPRTVLISKQQYMEMMLNREELE